MPAPSAEHRLAHVLRHLDAVCHIPLNARPGYDGLAPVRLPPVTTAADTFFRGHAPLPPAEDEIQWLHLYGSRMPVLFEGDIISTIFFWISGWQEFHSLERDKLGRFPYSASLQARLGCIGLPVADMLLEVLRLWLEDTSGLALLRHPPLPVLSVSHDVDRLRGGWRATARHYWHAGQPFTALKCILHHFTGRDDPFDNLILLAKIVREETSLASTFFFLGAQDTHSFGPNADYDLSSAKLQRRIHELESLGCSIGLHGSFGSSDDSDQLRIELNKLPHITAGVRFHFLRFDPIKTPDVLMRAGATYDATLGFAERAGFRHGTAHPFWLYDFHRQRTHRIVCQPLHVMDVTFANPSYQFTPAPDIPYRIADLAKAAQICGGSLSILWHNQYIVFGEEVLGEDTLRKTLRLVMQGKYNI